MPLREVWQPMVLRVLSILLILLSVWLVCHTYMQSRLETELHEVQQVQLAELDRQLTQLSFIPKLLAGDSDIKAAISTLQQEALQQANYRLSETQQHSGLDFAFLLDTNGLTIASSNWADPVSFVGINYGFRPYFKAAVQGRSATFFAVGATTGIPGYFIAEPVRHNDSVSGVVVAKVSLGSLVDAWSQLPYESIIIDEYGTIILSTRDELLYTSTQALGDRELAQLKQERRYTLLPQVLQPEKNDGTTWRITDDSGDKRVLVSNRLLTTEPWNLASLIAQRSLIYQTAMVFLAVTAVLLISYLFIRLYHQQRRLISMERRNAQELEEQVELRTGELAAAHKQLVSESNFAMLGRLSAAINHEINQPLASLRLNHASLRTLVSRPDAEASEIQQIVIDNDRTVKRIGRVVSSLRSVTRQRAASFTSCSVASLLSDVRQTLQRERPAMSQRTEWMNSPHGLVVDGDEVLLQQALLNLLYNAFDAVLAVDEPRIRVSWSSDSVSTAAEQSNVAVYVDDNGAGVPADMVDSLFEPFSTAGHQQDGLGLGLTLARQIAEDHGGQLVYERRETGSRFVLKLPLSRKSSLDTPISMETSTAELVS